MASTPLSMHRFKDSDDIEYYFQRELDKFPHLIVENQEHPVFAEFGALMIRPKDESKNKLTHLVYPETLLALPNVEDSFQCFPLELCTISFVAPSPGHITPPDPYSRSLQVVH